MALRHAVTNETVQRRHDLARAKARAEARREAARKAAAEKRARARAAETASRSRGFSSVSRGVERMSASASHALQLASAAASGAYYTHGGAGPNGFDCSGFVMYVMGQMGISLPHSAASQRSMVQSVSNPQPGDLVFVYNGGGGSVGHVAIYAGNGMWWEAANPSVGVGLHHAWSSAVSYGRVL
jgi:cell wall-associated NlpC family hydrolase